MNKRIVELDKCGKCERLYEVSVGCTCANGSNSAVMPGSATFTFGQLQAYAEIARPCGTFTSEEFQRGQNHAIDTLLGQFPSFCEHFKNL